MKSLLAVVALVFAMIGCIAGPPGLDGAPGMDGAPGEQGPPGEPGKDADSLSGPRLRARFIVGDDGSKQRTGDWLDTVTGEPCTYESIVDNVSRCFPYTWPNTNVRFSDALCTHHVAFCPAGAPQPAAYIKTFITPVDAGKPIYVKVETQLPPLMAYGLTIDGDCVPVQGSIDYDFYEIEVLQLDYFIAGTIAVE